MRRAVAFVLLICAPLIAAAADVSSHPLPASVTQQEMNKAVARRVFEEIFNQGKFQVAGEIYSPDFVNHGMHRDASLQEDQAAVHWEKRELPDLKMTVGPIVAEGDFVSVLWTLHGTNTAMVGWLPATGAKIEVRGITIWRIVDGRIREEWTSFDQLHVLRAVLYQLRWQLLGLACVLVILLWAAGKGLRKLRSRYSKSR